MALQTQHLQHYSDLGTTSESESSVYSILPPYTVRTRNNNRSHLADDEPRRKIGARAMRRLNNDAYLKTVANFIGVKEEEELDYNLIDTDPEISGFSTLFNDDVVRQIWDEFISLDEKSQTELLTSLSSNVIDSDFSDDDVDASDGIMRCLRKSKTQRRCHHGNKRRQRRHPLVILETIGEEADEASMDAFESFQNSEELQATLTGTISSALTTPTCPPALHDEVMDFADPTNLPTPGSLSPKLLKLIHSSVLSYTQPQGGKGFKKRREQRFCVRDLCLINQVESELRRVFKNSSFNQMWTPSTSLLRTSNPQDQWIRGRLLVLNGFQRMLVHASAMYLGLHSYSHWDEGSQYRQLWVDGKGGNFHPPEVTLVTAIYNAMQSMLPQEEEGVAAGEI
ncbi:hypothetical protein Aperf_G00000061230 [Anoplocephala perfoliata]